MAGSDVEYESQTRAWIQAYEALPEARKQQLVGWFATQRLIAENAGIPLVEWCRYLDWAFNNPMDFRFVLDFPERPVAKPRDDSTRGDETRKARELVGAAPPRSPSRRAPSSPAGDAQGGVDHELLAKFVSERLKPGSK